MYGTFRLPSTLSIVIVSVGLCFSCFAVLVQWAVLVWFVQFPQLTHSLSIHIFFPPRQDGSIAFQIEGVTVECSMSWKLFAGTWWWNYVPVSINIEPMFEVHDRNLDLVFIKRSIAVMLYCIQVVAALRGGIRGIGWWWCKDQYGCDVLFESHRLDINCIARFKDFTL